MKQPEPTVTQSLYHIIGQGMRDPEATTHIVYMWERHLASFPVDSVSREDLDDSEVFLGEVTFCQHIAMPFSKSARLNAWRAIDLFFFEQYQPSCYI